jgi:hypothetical protein|tara:strand:+ start:3623 stop:4114 length:492 start_codon:yes stop_codon:yes gene_type:complete
VGYVGGQVVTVRKILARNRLYNSVDKQRRNARCERGNMGTKYSPIEYELRNKLLHKYGQYETVQSASKLRLDVAEDALKKLGGEDAQLIKSEARWLKRSIRGLGEREAVALIAAIGKFFVEQPEIFESILEGGLDETRIQNNGVLDNSTISNRHSDNGRSEPT